MENILILDLLSQILRETQKLTQEIFKIRTKIDSRQYQIATKFGIITNDILVTKNSYRNTQRSYQAIHGTKLDDLPVTLHFD